MHRCPLVVALALLLPLSLQAADGDLDLSFSEDGKVLRGPVEAFDDIAEAHAVVGLPDGSVFVGGFMGSTTGFALEFALMKLRPDGTADSTFSGDGIVKLATSSGEDAFVREIFVQTTGAIVLAGWDGNFHTPITFGRILATGAPDLAFGPGGIRTVPDVPVAGGEARAQNIAQGPDGSFFVAGRCVDCEPNAVFVVRLDPDGEVDPSFADDGWAIFSADPGENHTTIDITVDEAGRPLIAGSLSSAAHDMFIVRLTAGGNFDTTFGGGDGIAFVDNLPVTYPSDVQIDPVSGRILIAGGSSIVARTSTGDPDSGFGFGGALNLDLEEGTLLTALIVQSDRKVVAVGRLDHTGPDLGGFFLARLLLNGALDNSFDGNGVVRYEWNALPDEEDTAHAVALVGGKLVVAGVAGSPSNIFQRAAMAILRTQSALIFTDGFERGSAFAWLGN